MHLLELLSSTVAEIVAVADEDEETVVRSKSVCTATWTIIPPKCAEGKSALRTTMAIQSPPEITNQLSTTAVSRDTSSPTVSTLNMPGINATNLIKAQHPHRLLQPVIAT